ncbi:MAG: hypothetical protein IJ119_04590 [Clostridia bacterium]|nr:hypothetical protein [Clostridia bacterium]
MDRNLKVVAFKRSSAYVHHRAMMNRRENNIVDALELMRRAVEAAPENREYRLDLAELYCEMGCHEQSTRLLLDMLAEDDGPSECYYGLALNQLGMNDLTGARRSLSLYKRRDPEGAHLEEVQRLAAELDFFGELTHPVNRKLHRAACIANRACDAMKADMNDKACRLFERSLGMSPEQNDMRALYAMALLICGRGEEALAQAGRAAEGYPPSVKALCVSAQVFALSGDARAARALIARAMGERPEGQDLRLMIYVMGELGMDADVANYVRQALWEAPFDRDLLHMRAVALNRTGTPDSRVARFWARILRIDPADSVAQFYQEAALNGRLNEDPPDYGYQVPRREFERRLRVLVEQLSQGYEQLEDRWREDPGFRQLMGWAVRAEDPRLSRAAMTALTTIDHRESRSLLRMLLFNEGVPGDLKVHAALALRLQGIDSEAIMPAKTGLGPGFMPDAKAMMDRLGVGERQLVRYADEVLQREYGIAALSHLLLIWSAYRQLRGTSMDPVRCVGGGAAALAYSYMLVYGPKPDAGTLAEQFGCDARQLVYYARRIASCLDRIAREI